MTEEPRVCGRDFGSRTQIVVMTRDGSLSSELPKYQNISGPFDELINTIKSLKPSKFDNKKKWYMFEPPMLNSFLPPRLVKAPGKLGSITRHIPIIEAVRNAIPKSQALDCFATLCRVMDQTLDLAAFLRDIKTGRLPGKMAGMFAAILESVTNAISNGTNLPRRIAICNFHSSLGTRPNMMNELFRFVNALSAKFDEQTEPMVKATASSVILERGDEEYRIKLGDSDEYFLSRGTNRGRRISLHKTEDRAIFFESITLPNLGICFELKSDENRIFPRPFITYCWDQTSEVSKQRYLLWIGEPKELGEEEMEFKVKYCWASSDTRYSVFEPIRTETTIRVEYKTPEDIVKRKNEYPERTLILIPGPSKEFGDELCYGYEDMLRIECQKRVIFVYPGYDLKRLITQFREISDSTIF